MSLRDLYNQQINAEKVTKPVNKPKIWFDYPAQSGWQELSDLVKPDKWHTCSDPIQDDNYNLVTGYKTSHMKLKYSLFWMHCVDSDGSDKIVGFSLDDRLPLPQNIAGIWSREIRKKKDPKTFLSFFEKIDLNNFRANAISNMQQPYQEKKQKVLDELVSDGFQFTGSQQYVSLYISRSVGGSISHSYFFQGVLFRDGFYYLPKDSELSDMESCLPIIRKINGD